MTPALPARLDSPLAVHLASAFARDAFGVVALAPTRAAGAPIAHAMLRRAPHSNECEVDGKTYLVAQYSDSARDAQALAEVVALVGTWRTAFVLVRGRYYAPGQPDSNRLAQWLQCYARMTGLQTPRAHCEVVTDRIYALEQGEQPGVAVVTIDARTGAVHTSGWMPEQADSSDPRLVERYRLPCLMLKDWTSRALDRHSTASGADQLQAAAAKFGFDRCPRYDPTRLGRLK